MMFQQFKKSGFVFLLPLVASAVVCADGIRTYAIASNAESVVLLNNKLEPVQEQNEGLDRTMRAHYIELDQDGRLSGEISAIEKETGNTIGVANIKVTLVRNQEVISRTMTEPDGTFQTDQISTGNYTLCISGDEGFLAYGIHAVERGVAPGEAVPVPGLGSNRSSTGKFVLTSYGTANSSNQDDPVKITAAVIPPEFTALQEIMSTYVPRGVGMNGAGEDSGRINVKDSVIEGGFQISLREDGKLAGRIAPLSSKQDEAIRLQNMNAFLVLNDTIHARTKIKADGTFEFQGIKPGVYGFVAAGSNGFAALSFQAVEFEEDLNGQNNGDSPFRTVSNRKSKAEDVLQVAICPASDVPFLRREIELMNDPAPIDAPVDAGVVASDVPMGGFGAPAGGFDGGGFGFDSPGFGGGGGGGGFDIGGLVTTGLGIWVITELFDNDDDDRRVQPNPVSPF